MKIMREILLGFGTVIMGICAFIYGLTEASPAVKYIAVRLFFLGVVVFLVGTGTYLYRQKEEGLRSCLVFSSAHLREPIASSTPPVASIAITNTGQVSAYNLRISVSGELLRGKDRKRAKKGKLPGAKPDTVECDGVIIDAAKGRFFYSTPSNEGISSLEISSVENGIATFYAWGEVLYDDMYGNDRSCRFCAFTNDINSAELTRCPKGNVTN